MDLSITAAAGHAPARLESMDAKCSSHWVKTVVCFCSFGWGWKGKKSSFVYRQNLHLKQCCARINIEVLFILDFLPQLSLFQRDYNS